ELKQATLADVVLYDAGGHPLVSTLGPLASLGSLAAPPDERQLRTDQLLVDGITYQTVVAPLRLRGATVGAIALALPTDLVARDGAETRGQLAVLFGAAMVAAVLLGFLIARRIAGPIGALAAAARGLERGDLTRRSGL